MYEYRCNKCGNWFVSRIQIFVDQCKVCNNCKEQEECNALKTKLIK